MIKKLDKTFGFAIWGVFIFWGAIFVTDCIGFISNMRGIGAAIYGIVVGCGAAASLLIIAANFGRSLTTSSSKRSVSFAICILVIAYIFTLRYLTAQHCLK